MKNCDAQRQHWANCYLPDLTIKKAALEYDGDRMGAVVGLTLALAMLRRH